MPAIKSDELAKRTYPRIVAGERFGVTADGCVHRFKRGLPEQAFDERTRGRMIEHEPVVSRQGQPEPAKIREVDQTVA